VLYAIPPNQNGRRRQKVRTMGFKIKKTSLKPRKKNAS
jgi:hypothetical protein